MYPYDAYDQQEFYSDPTVSQGYDDADFYLMEDHEGFMTEEPFRPQNPYPGQGIYGPMTPSPFGPSQGGMQGPSPFGPSQGGMQGPPSFGPPQGGMQGPPPFGPPQGGMQGPPPFGPSQGGMQGPPPFGLPGQGSHTPPQHGGPPTAPPPFFTPQLTNVSVTAIDAPSMRRCLYRNTYVWLMNGRGFWFYPTYVGRTSVAGYRWRARNQQWAYFGIDAREIRSFQCF